MNLGVNNYYSTPTFGYTINDGVRAAEQIYQSAGEKFANFVNRYGHKGTNYEGKVVIGTLKFLGVVGAVILAVTQGPKALSKLSEMFSSPSAPAGTTQTITQLPVLKLITDATKKANDGKLHISEYADSLVTDNGTYVLGTPKPAKTVHGYTDNAKDLTFESPLVNKSTGEALKNASGSPCTLQLTKEITPLTNNPELNKAFENTMYRDFDCTKAESIFQDGISIYGRGGVDELPIERYKLYYKNKVFMYDPSGRTWTFQLKEK